jgi:glycosyltransferase involved in cell wall biosynthesis
MALGFDVRVLYQYELDPPPDLRHLALKFSGVPSTDAQPDAAARHFLSSSLFLYVSASYFPLFGSIRDAVTIGRVLAVYYGFVPAQLVSIPSFRQEVIRDEEDLYLLHYAHQIIAASEFSRDELQRLVGIAVERISVNPFVVPVEQFFPGEPDPALSRRYNLGQGPLLLYVGRMAPHKGIPDLIRALAKVKAKFSDAKLLLVGKNDGHPYALVTKDAQNLAKELGLSRDVIFAGQENEAVTSFYRLCDVCVTASYQESFCLPVVEAMACGKPVVASRAGALSETVGPYSRTFPTGDVDAMAQTIIQTLSEERPEPQRLVEWARRFSFQAFHERFSEVVANLVDGLENTLPHQESVPFPGNRLLRNREIAVPYQDRSHRSVIGRGISLVRERITRHLRLNYLRELVRKQDRYNDLVYDALLTLKHRIDRMEELQSQLPSTGHASQDPAASREESENQCP